MVFNGFKTTKGPALFDIRINATDSDVVVVKGSPNAAPSVLLSGTIVLSVLEPVHIKGISLKLVGSLKVFHGTAGTTETEDHTRSVKFSKIFFEHTWDNISIERYLDNLYENYGKLKPITSKSSENLSSLGRLAKSSNSLVSLGNSSGHHRTLVKGNYEFPFSAILPGSLTESVEGLSNATATYMLYASIERSKYAAPWTCSKHLRIIRTLAPDAVELTETTAVENTWPNKVDYFISIPAKAIPIGSSTKIDIVITPLLKRLKLGTIKINLIEQSQCCGGSLAVESEEKEVCSMKIKDPLRLGSQGDQDCEVQDKWKVETILKIPASLLECTQDCSIFNNIKVRHKLKFAISLINPDGHVSQLRATLPVQLFISPFIPLQVKAFNHTPDLVSHESHANKSLDIKESEETIFERSASMLGTAHSADNTTNSEPSHVASLMAPPNYESHVYDRLFDSDMINEINNSRPISPINSLPHTPCQNMTLTDEAASYFLNSGANILSATIATGSDTLDSVPTALSNTSLRHLQSPAMSPSCVHLSRANSFVASPPVTEWEPNKLEKVPSYRMAIKSVFSDEELPPKYPNNKTGGNASTTTTPSQLLRPSTTSELHTVPNSSTTKTRFTLVQTPSSNSSNSPKSSTPGEDTHWIDDYMHRPTTAQCARTKSRYTELGNKHAAKQPHSKAKSLTSLAGLLDKKQRE